VTGPGKNNNAERMLYINLVVDSVRNSSSKPKIKVFEKNKSESVSAERTELEKDVTGMYTLKIDNVSDVPEFDFTAKFDSMTNLTDVYVFYDLNYGIEGGDNSNTYKADSNHVLIYHNNVVFESGTTDKTVKIDDSNKDDLAGGEDSASKTALLRVEENKLLARMRENSFKDDSETDLLALNSVAAGPKNIKDYFAPYGGKYTYIVIWAKDSSGKTASTRIKISLRQELFDLTQTEFNMNQQYIKGMSSKLDVCDRSRFNI
jgi:hypothetical protein